MERLRSLKAKLPKGWSYALKPSNLNDAIVSAGINLPVTLYQSYKAWEVDAPALSATSYAAGSYLGGEEGSFWVNSYAVPSDERRDVHNFAEQHFIPQLIDWMLRIEALPSTSTMKAETQSFAVEGAPLALPKRAYPLMHKGQPKRR